MSELRALRDLATEAFTLNSLNLEAAELRDKLAELTTLDGAEGIIADAGGLSAAAPTEAPAPDTPAAMREPPAVHEAPDVEADEVALTGTDEAEGEEAAAQLDASASLAASLEAAEKLAELAGPDGTEGILATAEGLSAAAPTEAPAPDTPVAMREPPLVHDAPDVEADAAQQAGTSEAEREQPAAHLDASAFPAVSPEAAEKLAEVHNADELGAGTVEVVESMSASSEEDAEPATSEASSEESSALETAPSSSVGATIGATEAGSSGAVPEEATTSSSRHRQPETHATAPDTSHAARPAAPPDAAPAHAGPGSKGEEEAAPQVLQLLAGGVNLPHPAKAGKGGEDAFFVTDAHGGAAGVADGVSAWANEGIDAALYSRCASG